jgi:hypothetical protein
MGTSRPEGCFSEKLFDIPLPGAFIIWVHLICTEGHPWGHIDPAIVQTEQSFGTHASLTRPPLVLQPYSAVLRQRSIGEDRHSDRSGITSIEDEAMRVAENSDVFV